MSLCVGGAASWKLKALQKSPPMHAAAGSKCASHQVCVESAEHRRRHLHHSHLCILQAPLLASQPSLHPPGAASSPGAPECQTAAQHDSAQYAGRAARPCASGQQCMAMSERRTSSSSAVGVTESSFGPASMYRRSMMTTTADLPRDAHGICGAATLSATLKQHGARQQPGLLSYATNYLAYKSTSEWRAQRHAGQLQLHRLTEGRHNTF